jgi:uncharacterized protein (DUF433 family)
MITDWRDYLQSGPHLMVGKPVVVGTRIAVEPIFERVSEFDPP